MARGFFKYEDTKREWSIMVQEFFEGKITSEEFAEGYQALLEDNFDGPARVPQPDARGLGQSRKAPTGLGRGRAILSLTAPPP